MYASMKSNDLAQAIDARLRDMTDPLEAAKAAKYYGSGGPFMGIGMEDLQRLTADFTRELGVGEALASVTDLVEALWEHGSHEHRLLAAMLVQRLLKPFNAEVWDLCSHWLDEADTWELVDSIAVGILGEMVVADPKRIEALKPWTASGNFWQQRAAVMATLPLNSGGRVHPTETFEICRPLMLATEPHVRTALAWVIREVGAAAPEETAAFLLPYKFKVVNSLLREAARKLPRHLERAIVGG
jgi:3-methyladenine DNA glycosylase AlkD